MARNCVNRSETKTPWIGPNNGCSSRLFAIFKAFIYRLWWWSTTQGMLFWKDGGRWSVVAMWGSSRNQDVTDLKARVMLRRCDFHSRTILLFIRWFANIVRSNSKQQSIIPAMYFLTAKVGLSHILSPTLQRQLTSALGLVVYMNHRVWTDVWRIRTDISWLEKEHTDSEGLFLSSE